jgi:hypothetical protein
MKRVKFVSSCFVVLLHLKYDKWITHSLRSTYRYAKKPSTSHFHGVKTLNVLRARSAITIDIYSTLAAWPQCYCGGIREMLTFLINLSCPKAYHGPGHSIRIVEYHRKNYNP